MASALTGAGLTIADPDRRGPLAPWTRFRGLVIAAGSIFLIAPIRAHLLGLGMDETIAM